MCHRPIRELSPLDAEGLHYQEDQYGDDLLASIKSALHQLVQFSDCAEHLEAGLGGMALLAPLRMETLTWISSSRDR